MRISIIISFPQCKKSTDELVNNMKIIYRKSKCFVEHIINFSMVDDSRPQFRICISPCNHKDGHSILRQTPS